MPAILTTLGPFLDFFFGCSLLPPWWFPLNPFLWVFTVLHSLFEAVPSPDSPGPFDLHLLDSTDRETCKKPCRGPWLGTQL